MTEETPKFTFNTKEIKHYKVNHRPIKKVKPILKTLVKIYLQFKFDTRSERNFIYVSYNKINKKVFEEKPLVKKHIRDNYGIEMLNDNGCWIVIFHYGINDYEIIAKELQITINGHWS